MNKRPLGADQSYQQQHPPLYSQQLQHHPPPPHQPTPPPYPPPQLRDQVQSGYRSGPYDPRIHQSGTRNGVYQPRGGAQHIGDGRGGFGGDGTPGSRMAAERNAGRAKDAFAELSAMVPDVEIGIRKYHLEHPEAVAAHLRDHVAVDGNADPQRSLTCIDIVGDRDVSAAVASGDAVGMSANWASVALAPLADHTKIYYLRLCRLPLHGTDPLAAVGKLRHLRSLRIEECPTLQPASLKPVSYCEDLQLVSLQGCTLVEDRGLGWLIAAQQLQALVLDATGCTDTTMLIACIFPQLRRLSAAKNPGITDDGAQVVGRRLSLTHCRLAGCDGLTAGAVPKLTMCQKLEHLDLTNCKGIPQQVLAEVNSRSNQAIFTHPVDTNYHPKRPRPHAMAVPDPTLGTRVAVEVAAEAPPQLSYTGGAGAARLRAIAQGEGPASASARMALGDTPPPQTPLTQQHAPVQHAQQQAAMQYPQQQFQQLQYQQMQASMQNAQQQYQQMQAAMQQTLMPPPPPAAAAVSNVALAQLAQQLTAKNVSVDLFRRPQQ